MKHRQPLSETAEKVLGLEYLAAQGQTQQAIRARQELAEMAQQPATAATPPVAAEALVVLPATPVEPTELAELTPPGLAATSPAAAPDSAPEPDQSLSPALSAKQSKPRKTDAPTAATGTRRRRQSTPPGEDPKKESTYYNAYRQERFPILLHRRYNMMLREISLAYELAPGGEKLPMTELAELAIDKLADFLGVKKRG